MSDVAFVWVLFVCFFHFWRAISANFLIRHETNIHSCVEALTRSSVNFSSKTSSNSLTAGLSNMRVIRLTNCEPHINHFVACICVLFLKPKLLFLQSRHTIAFKSAGKLAHACSSIELNLCAGRKTFTYLITNNYFCLQRTLTYPLIKAPMAE